MTVTHLTAVEVGCSDCAWKATTTEDRRKKAEARRHSKTAGHTTWADSYYSAVYEPKTKKEESADG